MFALRAPKSVRAGLRLYARAAAALHASTAGCWRRSRERRATATLRAGASTEPHRPRTGCQHRDDVASAERAADWSTPELAACQQRPDRLARAVKAVWATACRNPL